MTGDITMAITLSTYGTAFLRDGYDIASLTLDHSSFHFVNKVNFVIAIKHFWAESTWHQYAADPISWLSKLKEEGCLEIRMIFQVDNSESLNGQKIPDYKLAGFVGGGGRRYLQTVFKGYSELWQSREEVTDRDSPDQKIWAVSYGRILTKQKTQAKSSWDIATTKKKLEDKLTEMVKFAQTEKLTFWAEWFSIALEPLHSNEPFEKGKSSPILPPDKINLTTMQLLAGSQKAWCFGGMGSWNDIGFKDQDTDNLYNKLTAELYEVVNESYLCVANSY
jgi:hypothetical protein